jgi:hypothetical protein
MSSSPAKVLFLTLIVFSGCNYERVYLSDIDKIIDRRSADNAAILDKISYDVKIRNSKSDSIIFKLSRLHQNVINFFDSLDQINDQDLPRKYNHFVKREFPKLNYDRVYIPSIDVDHDTPPSLVKLQLAELENIYLRNWEYWTGSLIVEFNALAPIILPDKLIFNKNESVTGKVTLASYSNDLVAKMKVNGRQLHTTDGFGYFTIDISRQNAISNTFDISAEIIVTGDTVPYRTQTSVYINNQ